MMYVGDILSTVGVFSTMGDIMINVGEYLEHHGGVQYLGGKILLLFEYSHNTEHTHGTHNIPPRY